MKRAVVFTGLIRDETKFLAFLDAYLTLPACAAVPLYFSTWNGELEKYPRVVSRLKALNAIVVEQAQPDLILQGHVLHQLVTWDLPFGLIDDDVFVYKSRPDFAHFVSFERFLAYTPVKVAPNPFSELTPQYRFLVNGMFGAQPFYINDMTFAGMAIDMRRLPSLSMVDMVRYFRMGPEQMIWAPQFLRQNSVLDIFFRTNTGLIFNDEALSRKSAEGLQNYPVYIHALAMHFMIVNAAVDFFDRVAVSVPFEKIAEFTLEQLLWEPVSLPALSHFPNCKNNVFVIRDFFQAIIEGHIAPSRFGDDVQAAIATLRENQGQFKAGFFDEEVEKYAAFAADVLGVRGAKVIRRAENRRYVDGARADWQQASLGTPLTEKLEAEINNLRRTLNDKDRELKELRLKVQG